MLDAVVLLLGAGVMASADLDKAGTLGVLASVPTLLLVLPHLPVAHVELGRQHDEPETTRRMSRRVAALISAALTGAGAVPLLLLAAVTSAHLDLAIAAVLASVVALFYGFGCGEWVHGRMRDRRAQAFLRPAHFRRRGA